MTVLDKRGELAPNGAADTVIDVRGLRMRYGSRDVLTGVDFTVRRGEVITLLGPNGAGKTTTVEILEGFRMRSAGEVGVLGVDPAKGDERWRARIGVVLQSWRDHGRWRVRDLLAHLGSYYAPYSTPERERPHDVDKLLETVRLAEQAEQRLVSLSGGSAAAWTSLSGSWAGPSCCSSTSRPPGSTRWRGGTSTIWCTACPTWRTPPSCSPPTTSPRPSSSPTVSSSWPRGGSSPTGSADQLARQVSGQAEVRWSRGGERFVHATPDATRFVRELFAQYGEEVADLEVRRASLEDTYMAMVHRQERAR